MGKFARLVKCICAIAALGILVTGLAAQIDKATEVSASSANAVFTASVSEDYTDTETDHATIRRSSVLTAVEVSKEASGSSDESITRRLSSGMDRTSVVRLVTLLTMVLAAATVGSSISRPVVHAEGNVHSAEQTIISYIHSQGNFIG